ncbi:MAG: tetratricopeptide repeat protein [Dehalococcoidia bacterium]
MRRAIEAGWLVAAVGIPLAIMQEQFMLGWIQIPKVFMLRSSALFLAAMLMFDWTLRPQAGTGVPGFATRFGEALRRHPARLVYFATAAVVFSNLISILFSPVRAISIWGIDPGWDTYALFSVASYVVIFLAVALHLRTREQIIRLLWALTAVSMLTSIYGIGQHFGFDFLRIAPAPVSRATLTFGNPIFGGAYLVMTVPLTMGLWMTYRDRMPVLGHVWIGSGLIALQFTALLFNLSRGPWAGFWVAGIAFLLLLTWLMDRVEAKRLIPIAAVAGVGMFVLLIDIVALSGQQFTALFYAHAATVGLSVLILAGDLAKRALAMVMVASAFALVMTVLPVQEDGRGSLTVGERIGNIGTSVESGLTNRRTIWSTAAQVFIQTPWVDTERFPAIPELSARALRPLVGYGPDMFGYAYPLAGETTYTSELASHGHSFLVHTALELGLLGIAAYLALIGALFYYLFRMMVRARAGAYPAWFGFTLVAITTVLIGRMVEQIPGKAQVSDLSLSWALAGVVVAMTAMRFAPVGAGTDASGPTAQNRAGPPRRASRRQRRAGRAPNTDGGVAWLATLFETPLGMVKVGTALLFGILVIAFWSLAVLPYLSSAITARNAQELLEAGNIQAGVNLYRDAVAQAPDAPILHLRVSQATFQAAAVDPDPENRITLLTFANEEVAKVLERNPLDHRAWSRSGEFQRELAIAQDNVTLASVRGNQTLVGLMPGFWQSWSALAYAYFRIGEYELAASVADESIGIANGVAGSSFSHYVRAASLEGLGRFDEAVEAANESIRLRDNTTAREVLARIASQTEDSSS